MLEKQKHCDLCSVFYDFKELVIEDGMDEDMAFHIAVSDFLNEVLDAVREVSFEEGYDKGYAMGYKESAQDIAEVVGSFADNLDE